MIPKIIHQIWIQGYAKIPDELKSYHLSCQNINKNFEHIFWDEIKIQKFLSEYFEEKYLDTYNFYKIPAQKADFARYAILYVYGGIYLDMDMVCRKNLIPFLKYDFILTPRLLHEFSKIYLNGIIGTKPKHPVFKIIFKKMFERKNISDDVSKSTGPGLFYDAITEYIKLTNDNNITLVDRKHFHPCTEYHDDTCPYTCSDCYIAHTNYGSWLPSKKNKILIVRSLPWIIFIIILIILSVIIMRRHYKTK